MPSGRDDARELGKRRARVVDVTQQVRDGQRIERRVGERQVLGPGQDDVDREAGRSASSLAQHRLARVQRD